MSQRISDSAAERSADSGAWSESEKLRTLDRWTWAAAICGAMALMVLIGIAVWGVARDFADIKTAMLQSEITRLRSHAARTTINIQEHLSNKTVASAADLQQISEIKWLRRHWGNVIGLDSLRLYSAILTPDGTILVHSDPAAQGKHLAGRFQPTNIPGLGDDVAEIRDPTLTFGRSALDIALPILFKDREIATYHSGLDLAAFQKLVRSTQQRATLRWSAVLAVVIAAGTAASVSFYGVTKRITLVRQAFRMAHVRRLAELGQLVGAIAHEIRNPLNAMRLNLHVLERCFPNPADAAIGADGQSTNGQPTGRSAPWADTSFDPFLLIEESNEQIHRIEDLIRVLLAYARPEEARRQRVDIRHELPAIVDLLRQPMARAQVAVDMDLANSPAWIEIDPSRFRQIVFNLLNNAKEATGTGGEVSIGLSRQGSSVELEVCDNGPGVPESERERVFEPFYTTKELSAGLGLSLVKRFVEETGGTIQCRSHRPRGACFHLSFPDAASQAADRSPPQPSPATVS